MTEEIKYYKEKEYPLKWIPAEEMEETPQQTIARLEQENKELRKANEISIEKVTVTAEAKRLQELEQENKELKEEIKKYSAINEQETKDYAILRNALEEIREELCKGRTFYEGYFIMKI